MKPGNKRLWNFFGFGVVLVWLVMMGVLVKKTYFRGPSNPLPRPESAESLEEVETWMAIYHYDDKIGYTHSRLIKQSDGFIVVERALMNLRVLGSIHRVCTEITGHLNEDASLRSFVFSLGSGLVRFEARGKVEDKYLVLKTGFGSDLTESRVVLDARPILSVGLWPHLMKKGITVGTRYRLPVFHPSIMAQRPVDVEVIGRETIVLDGRKWDALKVRTTFMSTDVFTWLGPNGERLKEEGLMGLRLVRVTEEQALSGIILDPVTDIAENASVASNKALKDTSNLSYLKVQLDGVNMKGLDLDGGRQRLLGSVLELVLESVPLKARALALNENEKGYVESYLKAEPMVQSDHPRIKTLAREIVGSASDAEGKARRILEWIYKSLDKRATVSVPNALGTLEARAGDCNEHAVLFAALLRAAEIPAKLCAGLVYTRGRFYYHAWNEVFLGQWISADALMAQMPADVTHIRFVEGGLDRQADMVQVIGRLELKVLEAR
jgi:hypothetical protein